jgi:hypothetical protein
LELLKFNIEQPLWLVGVAQKGPVKNTLRGSRPGALVGLSINGLNLLDIKENSK